MGIRSFIHKWGSPRWFYRMSGAWLPWLAVIAVACISVGTLWGLLFVPPDFKQGHSFRIMYVHVPAAAVAQAAYAFTAIAGAVLLIWRIKLAALAMRCAAPFGAMMTAVALATGSIWGKPTWGTWWVWDARITSVVILLFLYLGIIALYEARENKDAAARACAVLAIVGAVNLPIIHWSVEWWYSLHQPASISFTGKSSIHSSMLWPLLIQFVGFYALFGWSLLLRMRAAVLESDARSRWVAEMLGPQKES